MDDAAILDLPDDPAVLKAIIAGRDAAIAQRDMALFGRHKQIEAMEREARRQAASLAERDAQIAARQADIAQRDAQIEQIKREAAEQLEAERLRHKAELDAVLRRFYGPHSERFDPTQLLLFGLKVAEPL